MLLLGNRSIEGRNLWAEQRSSAPWTALEELWQIWSQWKDFRLKSMSDTLLEKKNKSSWENKRVWYSCFVLWASGRIKSVAVQLKMTNLTLSGWSLWAVWKRTTGKQSIIKKGKHTQALTAWSSLHVSKSQLPVSILTVFSTNNPEWLSRTLIYCTFPAASERCVLLLCRFQNKGGGKRGWRAMVTFAWSPH